ncbi:MAG TPA: wax ester/triacylglycerol synthase family O-acyltransferase [Anaeromyxobacteraceae bacterium]|nr:wax ester/triacylglycerol synthase family O-acyltransferase [Anaeromyxobacteraceae bacterium]
MATSAGTTISHGSQRGAEGPPPMLPGDAGRAGPPTPAAELRAPIPRAAPSPQERPAYDRLNAVDRQFLIYENAAVPMHIGGAGILEAGPLRQPDGALDIARIRSFIESRLPRIPRYRQVVAFTPLGRHIWVDDPHFDIQYHVRHTSLPRPGGEAELKALCGRLFSQGLDRSKPLWEVWIADGLEGDRFAFVSKVHHAMVDGVRSIDLVEAILTPDPIAEFEPARPWKARPRPSASMLALEDLGRAARVGIGFGSQLPELWREALQPGSQLRLAVKAAARLWYQTIRTPSETPLNRPIGAHRRYDWIDTPLAEVGAVRRALGGSVNDVVLATMTGGVRKFLHHRGIEPRGLDFRVMVPVSIASRTGRSDQLGNRLSAWMVPLPVGEADPRRQLELVRQTTTRLKEERNALGFLLWTQLSGLAPAQLLWLGSELMWRSLPCNMVVTNVPGPERTLHLLGARMLSYRGTLPLTNYLGLATAILSYQGTLQYGFTGDWDLVPDLDVFARCVSQAFADLRAAVP